MTPFRLATLISLVSLSAAGCAVVQGNGELASEQRAASGFDSITAAWEGDVDVRVESGATDEVTLELSGDANLLQYVETEVRSGTLEVNVRPFVDLVPVRPLTLALTVPRLDSAVVTGSGTMVVTGGVDGGAFEGRVTGSGDLSVTGVEADTFHGEVSGSGSLTAEVLSGSLELTNTASGDLRVWGGGDRVDVQVTGSGPVDARDFAGHSGTALASGSGDAHVCVDGTLEATVTGSGSIYSYCDADVEAHESGSGSVYEE